ncbi:MAG: c-type cytochrome [Saprospiraceae bacterium]|nr:c-type cytochrome [Saprospiraceae bacterium]MBK7437567.1 c-type cytochrome [Saprospiraceae bacterium]MBK7608691.1 c-type cytochrome [Saprospiraceae bacterium]MBK8278940.1 c-type cytochrome [Saprospiraceae bacterium]MBK8776480.1 c-type cytochrome [Saprospiraceae bacterium]
MKNKINIFFALMLWTVVGCGHSDGYRNYKLMCGNCHMDQAEGLLSLVPPLEEAAFTQRRSATICKIYQGTNDSLTGQYMPAFKLISNADLANVLNYIIRLKEFGAKPFTDVEIKTYIENCR